MSRIQRVLTIYTSLGQAFNYTLQATVPPHTLSKCSASLPRPNWEPVLYYSVVCVMGFVLFCILVASYFEADRIFVADILKRKVKMCNNGSAPPEKEQFFDLKAIGVSAHNGLNKSPVTNPKMAPLPANLLSKFPRPLLEIPNGHVQHKSRDSVWTAFTNTLKGFFVRKPASNKKKVENNNSISSSPIPKTQADGRSTLATANNHIEKEKVVTMETIIPEKSNSSYTQAQQKLTQRKTKAAKRSHADSAANVESVNTSVNNYDRRQLSRTNSSSGEKRATDMSITVKDMTPSPNVTLPSSTGLDTFDDPKIYDSRSIFFV